MRKRILMLLLALCALGIIWLFLDSRVFVVRNVRIAGDTGMAHDDVVRTAGVDMGGRMRKIDAEAIERNIQMSGALRCISVETEYPSTIVITAERRQGRLVADYGGNIVLMDSDGYVISVTRELPEGEFLYVTGLSASGATPGKPITADRNRVDAMCAVARTISECDASAYVSELNTDDVDSLYLYSRTGIKVMLGDSNNMENKIVWMKYALIDLESRGETSGKLDVTGGSQADYSAE